MNRLTINLATRPFRNNAVWWIALGTTFVFLAAASWYNARWYSFTGEEIASLREELRETQDELDALAEEVVGMNAALGSMDLKSLGDRSGAANAIIMRRLFSWTQLFDRLEKVLPENARLRSIRPAISREGVEINVDGMARDYAGLLRFEETLSDSDYFAKVYPVQESSRESQAEMQFNLAFGYVPEGKSKRSQPPLSVPAAAPVGGGEGEGQVVPSPPAGEATPDSGPLLEEVDVPEEEEGEGP